MINSFISRLYSFLSCDEPAGTINTMLMDETCPQIKTHTRRTADPDPIHQRITT
jgi:hypothetical protein